MGAVGTEAGRVGDAGAGVGSEVGICFAASVTMSPICDSSWVGTSLM